MATNGNGNGNRWVPWLIGLLFPALVGAAAGLINNLKQYEGRISVLEDGRIELKRQLQEIERKIDRLIERGK